MVSTWAWLDDETNDEDVCRERGTQRTKFNWLNLPEVIVFVICFYSVGASVLILKSLSALGDFSDEHILRTL